MIYAYKEQNEMGDYVDAVNQRFVVITASRIYGKRRPCWQEFESLEAALEYWELTPILPIPDEEDLTETEL